MNVKRILILGGGFAGLWSAVGAVRKLDELGYGPDAVEVMLVNRDGYHNIRVRNYEPDLTSVRVPLDDVLGPIGAVCVEGEVASIDLVGQTVTVNTESKPRVLPYDRLVVALGSQLLRPNIPGLAEHAFDVDTYNGAVQLNTHLQSLLDRPESPGRFTVLVVGAGLHLADKMLQLFHQEGSHRWDNGVQHTGESRCVHALITLPPTLVSVAGSTLSMPRSGAQPDTHQDPRTSAPGLPNRDYTRGHVETPLPACEHNWLPTHPDRAGRRPINSLAWVLCQPGVRVGS
jgi:hypothetical protein